MRQMKWFVGVLGLVVACSSTNTGVRTTTEDGGTAVPRCVPGATAACACIDGRIGAQRCNSSGAFDACQCLAVGTDAGVPRPGCITGSTMACTCTNGLSGAQVCRSDGAYAPCVCEPALVVDAAVADRTSADVVSDTAGDVSRDGAGDVPGDGGRDGSSDGPGTAETTILSTGTDTLVNAFPTPEGILVVHASYVALVDARGSEVRRWTSPREITAAAFDGTWLAVADRAMLNVLTPGLEVRGSGALTDTCVTGVIVSGPRFVCGPAADWDRVFYTHELPSGRQLGRSSPFTYQGTPMRRVPGRDDFVTVTTNSSPSDFYLHRVTAEHTVLSFGDSPYHGDFSVTNTYAFVGNPATHLVTVGGLLLQIYTSTCESMMSSFRTGCFMRDGIIGTLRTGESYVALTEASPTSLAALVSRSDSFSSTLCQTGCELQRIDTTARAITSTRTVTLTSAARIIVAAYDATTDRLVLGYASGDRFMPSGHTLVSLAF